MTSTVLPPDVLEYLSDLAIETDLSRDAVAKAIATYPGYRAQILQYAVEWHAAIETDVSDEVLPPLPAVVLPAARQAAVDPFYGKTAVELKKTASECDIPLSLLSKLEQRTIRAETIPLVLIQRLSSALGAQMAVLLGYLELDPTLAKSANYRSDETPHMTGKIDFATAVRNAPMDEATRQKWLSLSE
ncbi:MAG: hypothetical protein ACTHKD_06110 [Devosia sp.]